MSPNYFSVDYKRYGNNKAKTPLHPRMFCSLCTCYNYHVKEIRGFIPKHPSLK